MYFSNAIIVAAALSVANAAKFTMGPAFFQTITAGKALNLTWSLDAAGPVSITLKNGVSTNLKTVAGAPALTGLTGTTTVYTIPATLPNDEYAFEIDEGSVPNYSQQFALTGGVASSSGSTAASSTASSTSTVTGSSTSTATTSASTASSVSNSTITTSKTGSSTSPSKTGSSTTTSSTSTPSGLNSAAGLASPLALVFLAVAAVMTLQ